MLNKVDLLGKVKGEVNYLEEKELSLFNFEFNYTYQGEVEQDTITVVSYGNLGERIRDNLEEGQGLIISGRLRKRTEDNKVSLIINKYLTVENVEGRVYNEVALEGYLGQDPRLNVTESGTDVANVSLAVNENTKEEHTNWFNIVYFNDSAKNHNQYLSAGALISVTGQLQLNKWQDDAGEDRIDVRVIGNRTTYIRTGNGEKPDEETTNNNTEQEDLDVPF